MFCITPLCKKEKREEYSHSFIKKFASLWYILFILCARKTTLKAMDRDGGKVCRSGVSGLLIQIMGSGKFVNQILPIIILGTKIVRRVGPAPLYSSYKTPQKRGGGGGGGCQLVDCLSIVRAHFSSWKLLWTQIRTYLYPNHPMDVDSRGITLVPA